MLVKLVNWRLGITRSLAVGCSLAINIFWLQKLDIVAGELVIPTLRYAY
jgi:hypothetical protein